MYPAARLLPVVLIVLPASLSAQRSPPGTPIVPPPLPLVGSKGVVTVTPLVPRPDTRPCVVTLFERREFLGDAPYPLTVRPPANCLRRWSRVVLETEFDVTAGAQYDRTARIQLAGIDLFTGTTMEPRKALAPSWHVERDVTDYSAIFGSPVVGSATLANFTDAQNAGRIFWSARLVFYPAVGPDTATRAPDIVRSLSDGPVQLTKAAPAIARTMTLPRNIVRMAIDILAMPQHEDEMWARTLPDQVKPVTQRVGDENGLPFREGEVRIDGVLAGLAPVFPWVFTGGMGAWNWAAIPGVGALDLQPYRVDLTPFAGIVNDGRPHRIVVSVAGARNYMATTATLLAWRDPARSVVTGRLTHNTLASSDLRISGRVASQRADQAPIETIAVRHGSVSGYVNGSRGRVTTRIDQSMSFTNRKVVRGDDDDVSQRMVMDTLTVTAGRGVPRREHRVERFGLAWGPAPGASASRRTTFSDLDQELMRDETVTDAAGTARRQTWQLVSPRTLPSTTETLYPDRVGSKVSFQIVDSRAGCYDRTIEVLNEEVTAAGDRCGQGATGGRKGNSQ